MRLTFAPLAPLVLAVVVSTACSSGGGSAQPSDGATGGGPGSSDGATGGGPGSSDAADAPHPGDAGDAPPSGDGGDAITPMTADEVCRAAIMIQCQRLAVCQGNGVVAASCLAFADPCPDYYFNADSNRTVAEMTTCLGALAARTCTDIGLNLFPSCFALGKRPGGSGCAYASQCSSGSCGTGASCATCKPGAVSTGGSCATAACGSGDFCHRLTQVCTSASTIVYAGSGQPCDLSATPVVGCAGDLLCVPSSLSGSAGTCTPIPGLGLPCASFGSSGNICAAGTSCTAAGRLCELPGACGAAVCDASSYCKAGDGGMSCAPLATEGQPCTDPCRPPGICVGATGNCAAPRKSAEACDDAHPCETPLTCMGGHCQPLGAATCPASPLDGGTG